MSVKKFEQMTKAELLKAISQLKLQDKVDELKAKTGKDDDSLVNADYVKVLNAFKDKQDEINGAIIEEYQTSGSEDVANETIIPNPVPKTRDEEIQLAAEYNFTKSYVLVTDHDNTQSTDSDDLLRGVKIQWGNRFTLGQSDVVFMHGEPQYVRNGAIEAMKTMLIPTNSESATTRVKKRFSIVEVEGWDQDKIDALKEKQRLKRL